MRVNRAARRVLVALLLAVTVVFAGDAAGRFGAAEKILTPAAQADATPNAIQIENAKPELRAGTTSPRSRSRTRSTASARRSASTTATRSTSSSRPRPRASRSTSTAWAGTAGWGRGASRRSAPSRACTRRSRRRTRTTGMVACDELDEDDDADDPLGLGDRRLPRAAQRLERPHELHLLRRPQRRRHGADRLPDERHDLPGVQRVGRREPLQQQSGPPATPPAAATKVSFDRPFDPQDSNGAGTSSTSNTR